MSPAAPARSTTTSDLVGQLIGGRYEVLERLGEGGMGTVYVARHRTLNKEVALKTIHPRFLGNGIVAERFAQEAMVSAKLDHPNVASAMDYGPLPGGAGTYLAMQLVRGPSLEAVLEHHGSQNRGIPWPRACNIAEQIAEALVAAHAEGIVHRDLKPENILLEPKDDGDLVKILDFGIARLGEAPESEPRGSLSPSEGSAPLVNRALTRQGTIMGTPGYMAPEQGLGETVDHRADLYSLGVILWEMIAGRPLFVGETLGEIIAEQLDDNLVGDLHNLSGDPTLPVEIQSLCERCLQRHPKNRHQQASEIRDLLRTINLRASFEEHSQRLSPAPQLAAQGDPFAPANPSSAPRSKMPLLGAALAFLGIAGAGAFWMHQQNEEQEALLAQAYEEARADTAADELNRQVQLLLYGDNPSVRAAAAAFVSDFEPADLVEDHWRAVATLELARGCRQLSGALDEIERLGHPETRFAVERFNRHIRANARRRRNYRCVRSKTRQVLSALPESPPL